MQTKELILNFFREADELLSKGDTIQASEKYYKAAEEAIKLLANKHSLRVIRKVKENNHWKADYLFQASKELSSIYPSIDYWWKCAWILHVEGFHEANLDKIEVERYGKIVINFLSLL